MSISAFEDDRTIPLMPEGMSASKPGQRRGHPSHVEEEVNEQGDVIFQFKLEPLALDHQITITKMYQEHLHDLLKIVRLYYQGRMVLADSFAFLNNLHEQHPILEQD